MTSRTYASAPSLAMMRQALAASFCDEPSNYVINDDGTILHNGALNAKGAVTLLNT